MSLRIERATNADDLAAMAAARIDAAALEAIRARGRFIISLAGGSTPRGVYSQWAQRGRVDWSKVALVFGDERCVPLDDPQSNYGMVQQALLSRLKVTPYVLRMEGEDPDPDRAARRYDQQLAELLEPDERLDLALLGMGNDGHTASLFPSQETLREGVQHCVSTTAPDGKLQRLTLTVPCLRLARQIVFLVAGQDKAAMLQTVLYAPLDPERYPAQFFLRDERLPVALLLDRAAGAQIKAA